MLDWLKSLFIKRAKSIDIRKLAEPYKDCGEDKNTIDLVMSGSGIKFYAFLLALLVLHRLGYVFRSITGTSGGSMVGALLASVYDPQASREDRESAIFSAIELALEVNLPKLLDPRWPWRLLYRLVGLIKGKKILAKFREVLPATFDKLKVPFKAVVFQVNLEDPRTRILVTGDLPLSVKGSTNIPFLFDPIRIGEKLVVDGGWQMNLALPEGGKGVIALTFDTGSNEKIVELKNNIQLGLKLIDGAIDDGMRRAIKQAPEATVIKLKTSINGLDFFVSEEDKKKALVDGADSVKDALSS